MAESSAPSTRRPKGPTLKYMAKRVLAEFGRDGGTDQAAKLTYFMVLSIAPTMLALFSMATLLLADIKDQIAQLIKDALTSGAGGSGMDVGPAVDSTLDSLMGSATGGTVALIIGIATALWSASAYVKAYSRVANQIYEVPEGRGPVRMNLGMLAITLVLILGILTILISIMLNETIVDGLVAPLAGPLGAQGFVSFLSGTFLPFWAWLKWPVILLLAFALVSVLYWGAPNVDRRFRLISPGGVFAVLGIAVAAVALSIYMTTVASYSSYGAIGGIMAVLFALWVMNIVIIMGAEVDAEYERASELEAGKPAEATVTAPLRDDTGAKKAAAKHEKLVDEGRDIRLRHLHRDGDAYTAEGSRLTPTGSIPAVDPDAEAAQTSHQKDKSRKADGQNSDGSSTGSSSTD